MKEGGLIVCDSSSIIALSEVCFLGVISKFAEAGARFYIPVGVRKEVVDTPITTKSFRLEAVRISGAIAKGNITVIDKPEMAAQVHEKSNLIMNLANNLLSARGKPIHLIDYGETEALALALVIGCPTILVDEKTTRLLIENPRGLHDSLENRLGVQIEVNERALSELSGMLSGLCAIRSCELVSVGYTRGYLDAFAPKGTVSGRNLLFGALFAVKENGCSISEAEIREYLEMLAPVQSGQRPENL